MDQLIVALDVDSQADALALADRVRDLVGGFKIGSRLFSACGPSIVQTLVARDDRVFLDLKFHDIPHTVAGAVAAAARLGVWMLTVHAAGGTAMMRAARDAADEEAARQRRRAPLIAGITVLTSLDGAALTAVGIEGGVTGHVERLARLAHDAGLDAVVASPLEIPLVRAACGPGCVIVTPGIRRIADAAGDQRRTMAPAEALAAGADYLVVGRPILEAADARSATERLVAECRAAAGR